jgi:TetR/AcrR family transcriptional regulator, cholesterol catabolism regulator
MARASKTAARAELAARKHSVVRDEILLSATRLFAERGYRAISMDDIAATLEYTKSVIYYYFKSKNEILWQIICRTLEKYTSDIETIRARKEDPDTMLLAMLRQHALLVMNNSEWSAIFNRELSELTPQQQQQLSRMKRGYDAIFWSVYQDGVTAGAFRDLPVHIVIGGMLGMCNWLYTWYSPKGPMSAEEIADHFVELMRDGCRKHPKS